jgi:hypothetical protein
MANLKKLEVSDIVSFKDKERHVLMTKQEVAKIVRDFILAEFSTFGEDFITKQKYETNAKLEESKNVIEKFIDNKFQEIEKNLDALIEYKFNIIAQATVEKLLSKTLQQEIEARVEIRLVDMRAKKASKGFG